MGLKKFYSAQKAAGRTIDIPFKLEPSIEKEMARFLPHHMVDEFKMIANTKMIGHDQKMTDITGAAGMGTMWSQSGEIMTMIAASLSPKAWKVLYSQLMENRKKNITRMIGPKFNKVEGEKADAHMALTTSWIEAAGKQRLSIHNTMDDAYGPKQWEIDRAAWDIREDIEKHLGANYEEKGKSTDIFFRVKTKQGMHIHEQSLKKGLGVFLLQSTPDKIFSGGAVPPTMAPKYYMQLQRKTAMEVLVKRGKWLTKALQSQEAKNHPAYKDFVKSMKTVGATDLGGVLQALKDPRVRGDKEKHAKKALMAAFKATGDKQGLQDYIGVFKKHNADIITTVGNNPTLKKRMVASIRDIFPLRDIATGKENVSFNQYALNPQIINSIFGTTNPNDIIDGLNITEDKNGDFFLVYKAQGKNKKPVRISSIGIRERGQGYQGNIVMEMYLHKEFANLIVEANKQRFGLNESIEKSDWFANLVDSIILG